MLRFGIISETGTGENAGFARVSFDDTGIVSGWLSLPTNATKTAKHWQPMEIHTQVACLMDSVCEQGTIVMALWSFSDTPPDWATESTTGIQYADGTAIYYDVENKRLTVSAPGAELNIECKTLNINAGVNITGDTKVTGEITATKEVTAGQIALTKHKHSTPVGVSGLPIP